MSTKASIQERISMKRIAVAEHAYTGFIPSHLRERADCEEKRNMGKAILGYQGHLKGREDIIGTTFTRNVQKKPQKGNHFVTHPLKLQSLKTALNKSPDDASGYGAFDEESGYGEFAAPPDSSSESRNHREDAGSDEIDEIDSTIRIEKNIGFKYDLDLSRSYEKATDAIGGRHTVSKLLQNVSCMLFQRRKKKFEVQQLLKRVFEEHSQNGKIGLEDFHHCLRQISCVLSNEQILAIFGYIDKYAEGEINPMLFLSALKL